MYILGDEFEHCVFYVYTNYSVIKGKVVDEKILFLPGLTIASSVDNLQHNLELVCATLQYSARKNFKNNKIKFNCKVAIIAEINIEELAEDMLGEFNSTFH